MWYNISDMSKIIEPIDEVKIENTKAKLTSLGLEKCSLIYAEVIKGKYTWWKVWKRLYPSSKIRKVEAERIVKAAFDRYLKENNDFFSKLLDEMGLGIDVVVTKLKDLLNAHKIDTYRGMVTINPETGEPLKQPDNAVQLNAWKELGKLHGLIKEKQGGNILVMINAAPIEKPEDAGIAIQKRS